MISRVYFMTARGDKGTNYSGVRQHRSWLPHAFFVYNELIDAAAEIARDGEKMVVTDFRRVQ